MRPLNAIEFKSKFPKLWELFKTEFYVVDEDPNVNWTYTAPVIGLNGSISVFKHRYFASHLDTTLHEGLVKVDAQELENSIESFDNVLSNVTECLTNMTDVEFKRFLESNFGFEFNDENPVPLFADFINGLKTNEILDLWVQMNAAKTCYMFKNDITLLVC